MSLSTQPINVNVTLTLNGLGHLTGLSHGSPPMIMRTPPTEPPATIPFRPRLPPPPPPESPPEPPQPEPPELSLLDAYQQLVEPGKLATTGARQRSRHRKSAREFAVFLESYPRSVTPRVRVLDGAPLVLSEWAEWLLQRGSSATTVGHRLTDVIMICRAMVDAGMLDKMPQRPSPQQITAMVRQSGRPQRSVGKAVSLQEIRRLLDACDVAEYPHFPGISAPEWWRVMICWHALWGPRTQDIVAYIDRSKSGLRWDDVCPRPECPDADLASALPDLVSPHGWLYYPVGKDRKSVCPFVLLPMPRWMAAFIERFRGLPDPREKNRVFPVAAARQPWADAWSGIRLASGVGDHVYLSQGTGGAAAFRKTAARWWKRVTGSTEVAQYVLHHAEVTVAAQHYLDTMEVVVPQLLQHLDDFPLTPDA